MKKPKQNKYKKQITRIFAFRTRGRNAVHLGDQRNIVTKILWKLFLLSVRNDNDQKDVFKTFTTAFCFAPQKRKHFILNLKFQTFLIDGPCHIQPPPPPPPPKKMRSKEISDKEVHIMYNLCPQVSRDWNKRGVKWKWSEMGLFIFYTLRPRRP